nr:MAG TPA: hypothetical protein [Caudoviricetes sp.]
MNFETKTHITLEESSLILVKKLSNRSIVKSQQMLAFCFAERR